MVPVPQGETTLRGDLEWVSAPRLVEDAARRFPGVEALRDGDVSLRYSELPDAMYRSARAAVAAGLQPGDRAAVWAPNRATWVLAALGIQAAGGVLVPVNTRFKGDEAAWVLGKSGARILFTVNGFLGTDYVELLRAAGAELPALETIVVLEGEPPAGTISWEEYLARGEVVAVADAHARAAAVTGDDLADILFTSGTTGRPKGAMTTHGQNLRVFEVYTAALGLREGDRYLIVNPFFHSFGYKAGFLSSIMRGATILPHAVFDVPTVLERVERERVTVLPGPPTLLQGILDHPDRDRYDLSSLRLTITGSASVPVELIKRLQAETTFETILTGYGLTETSAVVSVCSHDDDPETIANWSGRAIPDIEVKVVDDDGRELPRGESGEVWVRGYNVTPGYWDEPEQTAATIDADGWLHTGDIGIMNERDYVKITDRKKDMFIVGGFNAYPAEIENMLLGFDKVAQAAVVGMPDARLGEVGMAFVIPRAGVDLSSDEVVAWSREHMANFKVPRAVEVVDELPLNASGKVLKYELRARAAAARPAPQDAP
jgi:acyl-CoA synthetase (AMP-forming)/AMP-acid ligase II